MDSGSQVPAAPPAKRRLIRRAPTAGQADIYLAEQDGRMVLVKDFSGRAWLMRALLLRAMLRHEHRVMSRVHGMPGVPRALGMMGPDTIVLEFIGAAETLTDHQDMADIPALDFFQSLKAIVRQLHDRGIAHGDIRRRNILVTPEGPYLLDFATGICREGRPGFVKRWLFAQVARADVRKVLRLQAAYLPGSLEPDEEAELASRPVLIRWARFLRKRVYRRLFKKKRWAERMQRWGLHRSDGDAQARASSLK